MLRRSKVKKKIMEGVKNELQKLQEEEAKIQLENCSKRKSKVNARLSFADDITMELKKKMKAVHKGDISTSCSATACSRIPGSLDCFCGKSTIFKRGSNHST
ncbi:uncharacterized protein [Spinacia oleracea]|uniref:Remorin C-terminal domain-containing protein n=1 Tax=Spinacia oleracea TaxID=3562 RepID=A0ABM3QH91_SPIOL|nr:uncharacterized protein LOC110803079 [Spinacia oleracea]